LSRATTSTITSRVVTLKLAPGACCEDEADGEDVGAVCGCVVTDHSSGRMSQIELLPVITNLPAFEDAAL